MAHRPLQLLPTSTITLIGSSQVIVSVYSVIKELVENSVDAGATSIDIKIENYGLDKIEVCDNGCGIRTADVPYLAKRHCTSKINSTEDLKTLQTYGFRGEALASLCEVSEMKVTTKTDDDSISQTYLIDHAGNVIDTKPSHLGRGTIIAASKLFHNLPVRKQYYASSQRKKEDLKKMEDFLMAFSIMQPSLRVTFRHDKELLWQKLPANNVKDALYAVLGRPVASQLLFREKCLEEHNIKISAYLPKPGTDAKIMSRSSVDRTFIAVNNRPVVVKELLKVLKQYYNNCHPCNVTRHPVCFVQVTVPSAEIDVNVEPNKTTVFIQNTREVQVCLEEILVEIYGPLDHVPSWHYQASDESVQNKDTKGSGSSSHTKHLADFEFSDEATGAEVGNIITEKPDSTGVNSEKRINPGALSLGNKDKVLPMSFAHLNRPVSSDLSGSEVESEKQTSEKSVNAVNNFNNNNNVTDCIDYSENDMSVSYVTASLSHGQLKSNNIKETEKPLTTNTNKDTGLHSSSSSKSDAIYNAGASCRQEDLSFLHCLDVIDVDFALGTVETDAGLVSREGTDGNIASASKETADCQRKNETKVSNWSRGNCLLDSQNTLIQPVQLLTATSKHTFGKHSIDEEPSERLECPAKRKKVLVPDADQTTLEEAFGLQSASKEEVAFEQFCLAQKLETDISSSEAELDLLRSLWENMTEAEKMKYFLKQQPKQSLNAIEVSNKPLKNLKPPKAAKPSVRDQLVTMAAQSQAEKSKKSLKKKVYVSEKRVTFDMAVLRNAAQDDVKPERERVTFPALTVIGPLKFCDAWLCAHENWIYLLNMHRLGEVMLYRKLKETYRLQAKPCSTPFLLDSRCVSETIWSSLKLLAYASRTWDTHFSITDERLVANGFDVRCCFDADLNLKAELVGLCDLIPAYSLKDLYEVLEILNKNSVATLGEARPIKVHYYLQGEAVRILKQSVSNKTQSDVQALLDNIPGDLDTQVCLHHKPLFHKLIDLTDI